MLGLFYDRNEIAELDSARWSEVAMLGSSLRSVQSDTFPKGQADPC